MRIDETFIPGRWIDNVDANDFVNLNKKPFSEQPLFLVHNRTSSLDDKSQDLRNAIMKEPSITTEFASLSSFSPFWLSPFKKEDIPSHIPIGYSENLTDMKAIYHFSKTTPRDSSRKTTYDMFQEIATSELKKMFKMGLFVGSPSLFSPSYVHPDVRTIALYGTKALIKEKKWRLKVLEKHLQTHEWMEQRLSIYKEIEQLKAFEKEAKKKGIEVASPAQGAKGVMEAIMATIGYCYAENPSIPFSLSRILPFVDIFLEHDLSEGLLNEEDAQCLIDDFYLSLQCLRFSLTPGFRNETEMYPFVCGETIGGSEVTKTEYRFLNALHKYPSFPFNTRVIWGESTPRAFIEWVSRIFEAGVPFTIVDEESCPKNASIHYAGMPHVPGRDYLYDAGSCDLEKIFFLSLNGGRDVDTGTGIAPITQPLRSHEPDYEEVLRKLKEMIGYILNAYAQKMNAVMYLNEVYQQFPLRLSLMDHIPHYIIQFGFHHLKRVNGYLLALQEGKASFLLDDRGMITGIESESSPFTETPILPDLIEEELERLPLYKKGKPIVRFYTDEPQSNHDVKEALSHKLLPKSMRSHGHHANILLTDDSLSAVIPELFNAGYNEIHVSKEESRRIKNGIQTFLSF
ncbi:hypothetical protein IMZ31_20475 (plasmid) [Pontibacillus sp. ALD_SL1]|uniref:pyruvate formate lyase family protein n=1 Tax=Pontibacillus sp. ALD_SL1 TaxID=2777185 RepID=UPI001A957665|nr:pyruvate formate lyase family protein [Pontibacillus sp. ALD_SL1]QST02926.1 hypothetical protein IMZ31_20475 [Pontibacillus sp. ALD_SL1]